MTKQLQCSCFYPWKGMSIDFSGNISVACCHFKFGGYRLGSDQELDIQAIWNGPWFQGLRQRFFDNDLTQSGCEGCPTSTEAKHRKIPEGLNALQSENYSRALDHWNEGSLILDSSPLLYQVDFGRECNLNCIMCPQTEVRSAFSDDYKNSKLLESIQAQYDVIARAEKVIVFGGEPLFIPESRMFIKDFLRDPRLDDVELHLVTNGTLTHQFLDDMKRQRRLLVSFSVDALGDNYEKIRSGARWERVERNVREFAALAAERPGWIFRINTVLMRSSIGDLEKVVQMALDLSADQMSFGKFISTRRTRNENLLDLARDSEEFRRCRQRIENVIRLLEEKGKAAWCGGLSSFLREMDKPSRRSDTGREVLLNELLVERLRGKSVVVWGTGSYYRIWLANWLHDHLTEFDFVGFVDNDPLRWGEELDGHSIYNPDKLLDMSGVDYIIVANAQVESVRNQVVEMGLKSQVL